MDVSEENSFIYLYDICYFMVVKALIAQTFLFKLYATFRACSFTSQL